MERIRIMSNIPAENLPGELALKIDAGRTEAMIAAEDTREEEDLAETDALTTDVILVVAEMIDALTTDVILVVAEMIDALTTDATGVTIDATIDATIGVTTGATIGVTIGAMTDAMETERDTTEKGVIVTKGTKTTKNVLEMTVAGERIVP
jgi:hypothetical protein